MSSPDESSSVKPKRIKILPPIHYMDPDMIQAAQILMQLSRDDGSRPCIHPLQPSDTAPPDISPAPATQKNTHKCNTCGFSDITKLSAATRPATGPSPHKPAAQTAGFICAPFVTRLSRPVKLWAAICGCTTMD